MRIRHQDRRQPKHGQLSQARSPRPGKRQVCSRKRCAHLLMQVRNRHGSVPAVLPAFPGGCSTSCQSSCPLIWITCISAKICGNTVCNARLIERAPLLPPKTKKTGSSGSSPKNGRLPLGQFSQSCPHRVSSHRHPLMGGKICSCRPLTATASVNNANKTFNASPGSISGT